MSTTTAIVTPSAGTRKLAELTLSDDFGVSLFVSGWVTGAALCVVVLLIV